MQAPSHRGPTGVVRCPLIEEQRETAGQSANQLSEHSAKTSFRSTASAPARPDEATTQTNIMARFKRTKSISCLDNRIEVGIDVPNASVILIEDADTGFGLAPRHQLRGRVRPRRTRLLLHPDGPEPKT